jgi:hypothetical protein
LTSEDRTALARSSDDPTAFARIWFAPTLSWGSWVAAYDVPPSAVMSARYATVLRRRWVTPWPSTLRLMLSMMLPFLGCLGVGWV